jgi:hypothetical protein
MAENMTGNMIGNILSMIKTQNYAGFLNLLCKPAQVGHFLSLTSIIMALMNKCNTSLSGTVFNVVSSTVFSLLYVIVLNYMCSLGWTTLSWAIVGVPYILMAYGLFNVYVKPACNRIRNNTIEQENT